MTKWLTVLSRFFTFSTRFVGILLIILLLMVIVVFISQASGCARPIKYYPVEEISEYAIEEELEIIEELEQEEFE